jgi:hypothetical protein
LKGGENMLKPSSGRNKGRQGLAWGKGTKRLVGKIKALGYELKCKDGNLTMTFVGHCPPYEKKIRPVLHAIENNRDAVIEYLKFVEALKASKKGETKDEPISENETSPKAQCVKHERMPTEKNNGRGKNGPLRYFGIFKREKCAVNSHRN